MSIDNEYFCPAPWTSLYVAPSGQLENCCLSKNNIGNINQDSIQQSISGTANTKIKQLMLNSERVEGCNQCYDQAGEHTLRHHFLQQYSSLGDDFYLDTNNFKLKYLDLRWNNTCNLACIYCGPECSSLWAERKGQIVKMQSSAKNPLLDYALESAADIKEVYMAGGEPLLLKENEIFLNKLLEVNPQCRILVNTNLNHNLENNKIFNLLTKFKSIQWLISSETSDQQYEYIRWPGKWDLFYKNLKIIKNLPGHNISFNMVLMNINVVSIWDFIDMLYNDIGIEHKFITINIYNMKDDRGPWAIQRLTDKQRDQAIQRIAQNDYSAVRGLANVIDSLNNEITNYPRWNGLDRTVQEFQELDTVQGTDSKKVFPEIYNIIHELEGQ